MRKAFLLAGRRSPVGSMLGALAPLSAVALCAKVLAELGRDRLLRRARPAEFVLGCALPAGLGSNPAKRALTLAGVAPQASCWTVSKGCASGLKAAQLAAQAIACGADSALCAGAESSSNAVYFARARTPRPLGDMRLVDALLFDGATDCMGEMALGSAAEKTAHDLGITRAMQDDFAIRAAERAATSVASGVAAAQIVPVEVSLRGQKLLVSSDEELPRFSPAAVHAQQPPFPTPKGVTGTVTFGNAAKPADGACALLLGNEALARSDAAATSVEVAGWADVELDRLDFALAGAKAASAALQRAQLTVKDVDCWSVQENFAVAVLATCRQLGVDPSRVNAFGGALGFGHPLGMSGAFQLLNLAYELQGRGGGVGVAVGCNAGGGATAIVLRKSAL